MQLAGVSGVCAAMDMLDLLSDHKHQRFHGKQ
jgi:hypothetical protein